MGTSMETICKEQSTCRSFASSQTCRSTFLRFLNLLRVWRSSSVEGHGTFRSGAALRQPFSKNMKTAVPDHCFTCEQRVLGRKINCFLASFSPRRTPDLAISATVASRACARGPSEICKAGMPFGDSFCSASWIRTSLDY